MSDERLRELERRWEETRRDQDAEAYLLELRRTGASLERQREVQGRWGLPANGYQASQILAQLDECAEAFTFPALDNGYVYPGDARLSAYRDLSRWALVIEVVGYSPRGGSIDDCLHVFGNCLGERRPGTANEDFLYFVLDGPSGELDAGEVVNPAARELLLRGQPLEIPRDPAYYAARGVTLEEEGEIGMHELLRVLVVDQRQAMLATDDELQARLPADLPLFLRLDAWHHPDVIGGALPSQSETFRQLAEALVCGRRELYAPTEEPNTHWSNWPEGGAL